MPKRPGLSPFLGVATLLWIIGSINGRVWVHWAILWPWAAVALPIGLLTAGLANALGLGDAIASGLGQRVEIVRGGLFFVAALLTASAVSVVGAVYAGLVAAWLGASDVAAVAIGALVFLLLVALHAWWGVREFRREASLMVVRFPTPRE